MVNTREEHETSLAKGSMNHLKEAGVTSVQVELVTLH